MNLMRKSRYVLAVSLGLAVGALGLSAKNAFAATSLVGDNVEIWSFAQSNGSDFFQDTVEVVDPGVEYTAMIIEDIYDLNIGPSSIQLITLSDFFSPWFDSGFDPTSLQVRDIDVPGMPGKSIGGVDVIFSDTIVPEDGAPLGYPAFSADNVTFSPHSVSLQTGGYSFPTGARVQIDLTFVPEPGTAGLIAIGMFSALGVVRRRPR